MKQQTIKPGDLYQYLPKTGKRLIEIIGQESAFKLMQEAGGKTYINGTGRNHFFTVCASLLGDIEAGRVTSLLAANSGVYTYIPSLKYAVAAHTKAATDRAIMAQYILSISHGLNKTEALTSTAIKFDVSTTKVRQIIKGGHHA